MPPDAAVAKGVVAVRTRFQAIEPPIPSCIATIHLEYGVKWDRFVFAPLCGACSGYTVTVAPTALRKPWCQSRVIAGASMEHRVVAHLFVHTCALQHLRRRSRYPAIASRPPPKLTPTSTPFCPLNFYFAFLVSLSSLGPRLVITSGVKLSSKLCCFDISRRPIVARLRVPDAVSAPCIASVRRSLALS